MFAFRKKRKNGKKIDQLLGVLERNPEDAKSRLKLAELYLRGGDKNSAIDQYRKAAKYLGDEGFNLKAISIYKKLFTLDGMNLDDYKSLASLYADGGLVAEARKVYELVAQIDSEDGEVQEALKDLDRDGDEETQGPEAGGGVEGDEPQPPEEPEAVPIEALLASPEGEEGLVSPFSEATGETVEEQEGKGPYGGEDSAAEELLSDRSDRREGEDGHGERDRVSEITRPLDGGVGPDNTLRGQVVRDLTVEDLIGAVKSSEAGPLSPGDHSSAEDPDLHYHLGIAYREMELTDRAIEEFKEALQQGSNPLECLIMLGRCYFEKGLFGEAAGFIHQALELENLTQEQIDLLQRQLEEVEAVGKIG
ncbi:MAG: tetratricopeptide repeat protein [Deltaproteobacteria bacterium]|nr:tetratricopeptide repeat protein [Deltaproteobacteria bacterium]MBW2120765.1 tetratricopeptide repeat protein [Deltaproteobacteria bacterium]